LNWTRRLGRRYRLASHTSQRRRLGEGAEVDLTSISDLDNTRFDIISNLDDPQGTVQGPLGPN